jgi:hypothetical protein
MPLKTYRVPCALPDGWAARQEGALLDERHYREVRRGLPGAVRQTDGRLLFSLHPGEIKGAWRSAAIFAAAVKAATPTDSRPAAAAGAEVFRSGTVGYMSGRPVGLTATDPAAWQTLLPLLQRMAAVFASRRPREYAVLQAAAARTPPHLLIPGTAFTSAAVNRDARCGCHRDKGNLPGACGALTVLRGAPYTGGLLVFPQHRMAVDLQPGDVLIADNQAWHGNTEIGGDPDATRRVSIVAYHYRSTPPGAG